MLDENALLSHLADTLAGDATGRRVLRQGSALNKPEAALVARTRSYVFALPPGSATDLRRQSILPGVVVIAHETLVLLPEYPEFLPDAIDPEVALAFPDPDAGELVLVGGRVQRLEAAHHVRRFEGAAKVLALSVDQVTHVAATLRDGDGIPTSAMPSLSAVPRQPIAGDASQRSIVRISVSMPRTVEHEGKSVSTGIFKQAIEGPALLRYLNLEGDGQADLWGHGGSFRAVYAYPAEHYGYWASELARDDLEPGQFGENLTVTGMVENDVRVGDVYRVGTALVEVSQPRVPCFKLAIKMGIENFQARFLKEGRLGFYLRVLEEGALAPGDRFELLERDPSAMNVREVSDLLYFNTQDLDATRRALAIRGLAHGWKESFEERLRKAPRSGFRDFVVKKKARESETITSFYLEPKDRDPLSPFEAGQFLTFRLELPGVAEPVLRTYSLSDSPHCPYYRVSIKREAPPANEPGAPPGLSSSYFHDQIREGDVLEVGAPRGAFVLDDTERTLVLLSAGVGITPLLSMLNTVAASGRRVWFVHGARNGREHAFGSHVRGLALEHENVRVHVAYSAPDGTDRQGLDFDSRGRVSVELLKRILPFDDYEFYLVGPTPFMRDLFSGLCKVGVDPTRIHYEFFGPSSALQEPAKAETATPEGTEGPEVVFSESERIGSWNGEESLLDLAERIGLTPPYSCRAGICHTCKCRILEGEVSYDEEPVSPLEEGEALVCIAKPAGRVVLAL